MSQIIFSPSELQFASRFIRDLHQADVDSLPLPEDGTTPHIPDPCVIISALANLVDPASKKLGDSDFYYLLSHPDRFGNNPESEKILRKALFFPETDPEGIRLGFHTVNDKHGNQTAYVRLIPTGAGKIKSTHDPIVYLGGLHHSSAGYLNNLSAIARETHREIIIVDLPTMGGSVLAHGESVGPDELLTASLSAIDDAFPKGTPFVLAGHSLGSIVAKMIDDQSVYSISKLILDAPAPTIEDGTLGYFVNGNWTAKSLAFNVVDGGTITPIDLRERFLNAHSKAEIKALTPYIRRSRFESNLLIKPFLIFLSGYLSPILEKVGHDPKLRLLIHENDHLFQMENPESWQGRGIYKTSGDHDAAVGFDELNLDYIRQFERALNDGLDDAEPVLNIDKIYGRVRPQFTMGAMADSEGRAGPELSLGLRFGINKSAVGFAADVNSRLQFGYRFSDRTPFAQLNSHAGLTGEFMQLPINFSGGAVLNTSLTGSNESRLGAYLGLEVYVPDVFNLRLEYRNDSSPRWEMSINIPWSF